MPPKTIWRAWLLNLCLFCGGNQSKEELLTTLTFLEVCYNLILLLFTQLLENLRKVQKQGIFKTAIAFKNCGSTIKNGKVCKREKRKTHKVLHLHKVLTIEKKFICSYIHYIFVYLFVSLFVWLFVCLINCCCLFCCLFVYLFVYLFVCLFVCLFVFLFVCLFVCLVVCVCFLLCLFIWLIV